MFTATSVSPDPSSRQRPGRCAVRAWRYLAAEAYRYLWAITVMAAVDRGFGLGPGRPAPLPLGPGTGQVSAPIRPLSRSQGPVFLVNSRPGLFSATGSSPAALFPKLRAQFAEFLDEGSSARLRILSSPTCGGLRYGRPRRSSRGFSRRGDGPQLPHHRSGPGRTGRPRPLPAWTRHLHRRAGESPPAHPGTHSPPRPPGRRPERETVGGAGILTGCPSPTPFGLSLGPAHPTLIGVAWEPLGLRRTGFSPVSRYSCRHSRSSAPPPGLAARLRRALDAPLLLGRFARTHGFGAGLSPAHTFLGAGALGQ